MLRVIANTRVIKYSWICSKHFRESDYELVGDKRKLKKNAIPSLFLDSTENATLTKICISIIKPNCSGHQASVLKDINNFPNIQEKNIVRYKTILFSEDSIKEAFLSKTRDQEVLVFPENKDKATHISLRRLKLSDRQKELINENKYLKNRLRPPEIQLVKYEGSAKSSEKGRSEKQTFLRAN